MSFPTCGEANNTELTSTKSWRTVRVAHLTAMYLMNGIRFSIFEQPSDSQAGAALRSYSKQLSNAEVAALGLEIEAVMRKK